MSVAEPTKRRASEAYLAKLRDPRWQKKRLEILNRDGWMCQICGREDITLHVHHRRYIHGREPWDIDNDSLVTLCEECHEGESELLRGALDVLAEQARIRFFAYEIETIAGGINALQSWAPYTADVLAHVMRNPDAFKLARDHYWEHNANRNEAEDAG
jgi:hypothetical protein